MPGELERFREALLCKRRELLGDAATLSDEALRAGNRGGFGASHLMPSHMAELASGAWEQEFTLILMEDRQALLREVDDALKRIGGGTYGICEGTGRVIPKARLRAMPWARYHVEYARSLEAGPA
jgi:RNA polymerase-binding transcription factor DksA